MDICSIDPIIRFPLTLFDDFERIYTGYCVRKSIHL